MSDLRQKAERHAAEAESQLRLRATERGLTAVAATELTTAAGAHAGLALYYQREAERAEGLRG